jgi:hypothetical protein
MEADKENPVLFEEPTLGPHLKLNTPLQSIDLTHFLTISFWTGSEKRLKIWLAVPSKMENDAGDMVKFLGLAQEDKPSELCYINVHEHPMVLKKSVGVKEMVPWGFNFAGTVV